MRHVEHERDTQTALVRGAAVVRERPATVANFEAHPFARQPPPQHPAAPHGCGPRVTVGVEADGLAVKLQRDASVPQRP
jgi:hypothetical protein